MHYFFWLFYLLLWNVFSLLEGKFIIVCSLNDCLWIEHGSWGQWRKTKRQRWQGSRLDEGGIEANTIRPLIPLSNIALQANYIVVFDGVQRTPPRLGMCDKTLGSTIGKSNFFTICWTSLLSLMFVVFFHNTYSIIQWRVGTCLCLYPLLTCCIRFLNMNMCLGWFITPIPNKVD
jgi:hypothetical protein